MPSFNTDITLPRKIEEFVAARDTALKLLQEAEGLRTRASDKVAQFLPFYGLPHGAIPADRIEVVTRDLDRRFWRVTFEKAGFLQYMDHEAMREFEAELSLNPPEYNIDNIRSTLVTAAADSEKMFRRGLVNVFLRLERIYVTNRKEPFKVGRKCVIEGVFHEYNKGLSVDYHDRARLNDIDRIFKVLDGKGHVAQSLQSAIDAHFIHGSFSDVGAYEDDYYRIKAYRNSNMHIEFKRKDLLDAANLLIAKHYADGALADARAA